jgi:hypothetical protein
MALYVIPRWSVATAFVFHGGEVEVRLEHFIGSAAKPHALYLNGIVDLGSMEDSDYHRIVCYQCMLMRFSPWKRLTFSADVSMPLFGSGLMQTT